MRCLAAAIEGGTRGATTDGNRRSTSNRDIMAVASVVTAEFAASTDATISNRRISSRFF